MKVPPSVLDEIRARLPVSAVVGRRVQLKRKGREWSGLSPFNKERTPSFFVNDAKGFYHCFSSGQHGDIFRFVMETEGLSFPEAIERLAAEAGVDIPKPTAQDAAREQRRANQHEVLELAAAFFESKLQAREGATARGVLADRGLTPALQAEFRLGYSPEDRYALRDHLAGKGIDKEGMIEAGLLVHGEDIKVPYDRFRGRIMFPIQDARGRIIAFGGRAMSADAPAKYLNSPETELFHKGHCLFNHHRARAAAHTKGTVIAVEGYVDAIMMHHGGFPHTVAPLGTALTEDQLGLLWRMAEEPILCFDGDGAGRRAAYRAIDVALPHLGPGRSLRFALMPEGQDPDEIVRAGGHGAVEAVLGAARPLVEMLWARETSSADLSTPERRAALERRLNEVLTPIGDETLRRHYRGEMDTRLRALFGSYGGGGRGEGRGRGQGRQSEGGWRRDRGTPSAGLGSLATAGVREGWLMRGGRVDLAPREAVILAAVLNHPELLDSHHEALAETEVDHPEAARLRGALIDAAAHGIGGAGLGEPQALRAHLVARGLEAIVARIDAFNLHQHGWARPEVPAWETGLALTHMLALRRKMRTLHRELEHAKAALERDLTDENVASLADIKAQIAAAEGAEATLEGVGPATPGVV